MSKKALLVLEDGSKYEGYTFGAETTTYGEVVFDTAMTGYQEMLTDPSFAGQIVVPTYPLIGNYGINELDAESKQIQVRGFVVREYCEAPSHWQPNISLHNYPCPDAADPLCRSYDGYLDFRIDRRRSAAGTKQAASVWGCRLCQGGKYLFPLPMEATER